jgi:hypothetical protein
MEEKKNRAKLGASSAERIRTAHSAPESYPEEDLRCAGNPDRACQPLEMNW